MSTAIVPVLPGVLSAWGMLTVDMVQDRSQTILRRRQAIKNDELSVTLSHLRSYIEDAFQRQGVDGSAVEFEYFLDMQYYGQTYSLAVGLDELASRADSEASEDIRLSEEGLISVPIDIPSGHDAIVTDDVMGRAVETFHREHSVSTGMRIRIKRSKLFMLASLAEPRSADRPLVLKTCVTTTHRQLS